MSNNSAVIRQFTDEVLNQGKIEDTGLYFWEDMVEQVPFPNQGPGLQGLKDVLTSLRTAFPDMHWSIEEQICEGDKVVTRFDWTGTHHGDFLGIPATGRAVKVWGIVIDHFVENKVKHTRIIMDVPGLMAQLAVSP